MYRASDPLPLFAENQEVTVGPIFQTGSNVTLYIDENEQEKFQLYVGGLYQFVLVNGAWTIKEI
jgi:hypothetical protein